VRQPAAAFRRPACWPSSSQTPFANFHRSRVGVSRSAFLITKSLRRQQGCLRKAAAGCRSPCHLTSSYRDSSTPSPSTSSCGLFLVRGFS
jgi:hypothetical protein